MPKEKILPRGAWASRRVVRRGLLGERIEGSAAAVSMAVSRRAGRWKKDSEKQKKGESVVLEFALWAVLWAERVKKEGAKIPFFRRKNPSCPPLTAGDLRSLSLSLSLSLSQRGPSALRWRGQVKGDCGFGVAPHKFAYKFVALCGCVSGVSRVRRGGLKSRPASQRRTLAVGRFVEGEEG